MADTKVSAMTAASALTGAETLPVVQSAANRKATVDQVKDYIGAGYGKLSSHYYFFDDFSQTDIQSQANGAKGDMGWIAQPGMSGLISGPASGNISDNRHRSSIRIAPQTQAAPTACGISLGIVDYGPLVCGLGRLRKKWSFSLIGGLSAVANEYIMRIGMCKTHTWATALQGILLKYDRLNSVNFRFATGDGSTESYLDTGVPADLAWHTFEIDVNAAGTSCNCYFDGVLIGAKATNLPPSTAWMHYAAYIDTSVGNASGVQLLVDAVEADIAWTTPR